MDEREKVCAEWLENNGWKHIVLGWIDPYPQSCIPLSLGSACNRQVLRDNAIRSLSTRRRIVLQTELAEKLKWINVEDRLPYNSECIFILTECGYQTVGSFYDNTWLDLLGPRRSDGTASEMDDVTHWYPIIWPENEA